MGERYPLTATALPSRPPLQYLASETAGSMAPRSRPWSCDPAPWWRIWPLAQIPLMFRWRLEQNSDWSREGRTSGFLPSQLGWPPALLPLQQGLHGKGRMYQGKWHPILMTGRSSRASPRPHLASFRQSVWCPRVPGERGSLLRPVITWEDH